MNPELKSLMSEIFHASQQARDISIEMDDQSHLREPLNDILMWANEALDIISED